MPNWVHGQPFSSPPVHGGLIPTHGGLGPPVHGSANSFPEQAVNGDFSSGTGWTISGTPVISGGKANMGLVAFEYIRRPWVTPPQVGQKYRVEVVVEQVGNCQCKVDIGPTWDTDQHLTQLLGPGLNVFDFTIATISDGTEVIALINYAAGAVQAIIDSVSLRRTA